MDLDPEARDCHVSHRVGALSEVVRAGMPVDIPGMPPRTVDVLLELRAKAAERAAAAKGGTGSTLKLMVTLYVVFSIGACWACDRSYRGPLDLLMPF